MPREITFTRRPNDLVEGERVSLIKPPAKAGILTIGSNWYFDKVAWVALKQFISRQIEIYRSAGFYGPYCNMQYLMCDVDRQTENDELGVLVRVKEPHSERVRWQLALSQNIDAMPTKFLDIFEKFGFTWIGSDSTRHAFGT